MFPYPNPKHPAADSPHFHRISELSQALVKCTCKDTHTQMSVLVYLHFPLGELKFIPVYLSYCFFIASKK